MTVPLPRRKPVHRLQSQHAPPSPSSPPSVVPRAVPEVIIELVDESAPPEGASHADIMAAGIPISDVNAVDSLPTPPPTPANTHAPTDLSPPREDRPFPPSDALRKSRIPSLELPAAVSEEKEKVGAERASVLFAPMEKVCKEKYGVWKGLKGDPVKLERLNGPAKFTLESRWATC